jgi:hypothetical protein
MEDQLDTMIVQNKQNADETNGLLETIVSQNEKNNPQGELEVMIKQNEDTKKTIEDGSTKVADAVKELKPAMDAAGFIANFMQAIKGDKGDVGKTGEDGKTPVKGTDYFTNKEVEEIIKSCVEQIPVPENGKDGLDGLDADENKIIKEVLKKIPTPKDGIDGKDAQVDYDKIIKDVVKKLPKIKKETSKSVDEIIEQLKGKLSYDDLKDLPLGFRTAARDYDFIELKDTPNSYAGQGGKVVAVKADLSGLEFITAGTGDFMANGSVPMTGTFQVVAGTTTITPIKMTAGTLNTVPVAGAIEFDGTDLYISV